MDVTPARPTDAPAAEQDRAMNPARAQDQALLGGLPKTATGVQWHLLLGLSALLPAALWWKLRTLAG